jgi:hypothetical protein
MWISKAAGKVIDSLNYQNQDIRHTNAVLTTELQKVNAENARLRADMDWFKLRLNQVERERGQLIQAAIGVKIAVPEFVPTYEDPGGALNDMPALNTIGADALDQFTPKIEGEQDYSNLPGYERQK